MEIKIGDLTFTSEHSSIRKARIKIFKDGGEIADIDSEELKVAVEALEKVCWRP